LSGDRRATPLAQNPAAGRAKLLCQIKRFNEEIGAPCAELGGPFRV